MLEFNSENPEHDNQFKFAVLNKETEFAITHLETFNLQISKKDKEWALEHAAENDQPGFVIALLKRARKEISDKSICSALLLAADNGHQEIIMIIALLLYTEQTISLEVIDEINETFLSAADKGYHKIIVKFLEYFDKEITKEKKGTALRVSTTKNHTEIVTTILQQAGTQISPKDIDMTFLLASKYGRHEIVTTLLLYASEKITNESISWALNLASKKDYHEIVIAILQHVSERIDDDNFIIAFNNATALRVKTTFKEYASKCLQQKFNALSTFFLKDLASLACQFDERSSILTGDEFQATVEAVSKPSVEVDSDLENLNKNFDKMSISHPKAILTKKNKRTKAAIARAPLLFSQKPPFHSRKETIGNHFRPKDNLGPGKGCNLPSRLSAHRLSLKANKV